MRPPSPQPRPAPHSEAAAPSRAGLCQAAAWQGHGRAGRAWGKGPGSRSREDPESAPVVLQMPPPTPSHLAEAHGDRVPLRGHVLSRGMRDCDKI